MLPYPAERLYPLAAGSLLDSLRDEDGFVLLETSLARGTERRSLLFTRPAGVIVVHGPEDLDAAFSAMEKALTRGKHLAGWLSYELGYCLEPRLRGLISGKRPSLPLLRFGVFDAPRVFEHDANDLRAWPKLPQKTPIIKKTGLDTPRRAYKKAIKTIQGLIAAGDTYQVNYTTKLRFRLEGDPADLYLHLRMKQAVPFGAFIKAGDVSVLSFSPELFFCMDGWRITSRPMKGTMERGVTPEEDARMADLLRADPKNRAENVMIVDLIRNDMGRIARTGSVRVDELFSVERYKTLFQMTSTVSGDMDPTVSWKKILSALFPCGSVTGAPKIRTMEIIGEIETSPRGIYTGAIGHISPDRKACLNVAIRTVVLEGNEGEMGLGSGITADSDPDGEYEECRLKGAFLSSGGAGCKMASASYLADAPPWFSLVETLLWEPGTGFALIERHLSRLARSAGYFGFPLDIEGAREALEGTGLSLRNDGTAQKVRLLLDPDGSIRVSSSPVEKLPEPVLFDLSNERTDPRDPFLHHKTTHRPLYAKERKRAESRGIFETVFLNTRDEVTEGTVTNIFVKREGILFTPPASSGLLKGTLREELLARGEAREALLFQEDLSAEGQIYLGNSVRGLVRAYPVWSSSPGPRAATSQSRPRDPSSR